MTTDMSIEISSKAPEPMFSPVSPAKLVVMSIVTFGLYETVWFYMNWWRVCRRETLFVPASARLSLGFIYCYALFERVRKASTPPGRGARLKTGLLTVIWLCVKLMTWLPSPFGFLGLLSVFALVPVQRAAEEVNERVAPEHPRNDRFTPLNWIAIGIFGLLLLFLAIAEASKHL